VFKIGQRVKITNTNDIIAGDYHFVNNEVLTINATSTHDGRVYYWLGRQGENRIAIYETGIRKLFKKRPKDIVNSEWTLKDEIQVLDRIRKNFQSDDDYYDYDDPVERIRPITPENLTEPMDVRVTTAQTLQGMQQNLQQQMGLIQPNIQGVVLQNQIQDFQQQWTGDNVTQNPFRR
jgi:hypothetical protein